MPRPVSVSVTGNVSGFIRGANQVGSSSRQMAATVTSSAQRATRAMDGMGTAADRLARAERRAADAAGAVRVAETRLQQVRAQANVTDAQKVKAEEALAKSARRLASAQREVAAATPERLGFLDGVDEQSTNLDRISGSMLKVGASAAAGLGAATKAAMDWQSQWAGVSKTVDGSAAELGQLEDQLRGMARSMPTAHADIAAVAEAAGQLGVKTSDIASFTKTMVQLGDTTNLTADEAATSLAQFMNVMGTAGSDVGRLGATIVDLGNKGASTERDIVEMGQRIAGAGKQVGLSETDVLAFSNALASVGINAEAGGTAISTSFLRIDGAVRAGGAGLEVLADTAGMTSSAFKQAFQEDAAGAVNAFLVGLDKVQRSGGDTTSVLRSLSITGIRESDALRRLASSGDLLSESLSNGKTAWRENNALVEEAAKRYATAESQARIAWNQIKDSAISAGTSMLPILSQVATAVGSVAEFFGDLPEPVRIAGVALVATVATMGLIGGAGVKAVTGLAAMRTAYVQLGGAATVTGRAMRIATLSIPAVGVLLFAATTAMQVFASKTTDASTTANGFADAMQTIEGRVTQATAALNENVRMQAVNELQSRSAFDQARQLGLGLGLVTDAALGNKDALAEVNRVLAERSTKGALGSKQDYENSMAAGRLAKALREVSGSSATAVAAEKQRRDAMNSATGATDAARTSAVEMRQAQDDLTKSQAALAVETQKVIDKFTILNEGALGVERANQAWEESVDAVSASVRANRQSLVEQVKAGKLSKAEADARARSLDVNTEAGRKNRAAIVGQITALNDKVTADFKAAVTTKDGRVQTDKLAKATDIASEALRRGRKQIDSTAEGARLSKDEVKRMQDRMLKTPSELKTDVKTPGVTTAQDEIRELQKRIGDLRSKKVEVTAQMKWEADKATFDKMGIRVAGVNAPGGLVRAAGGPVWGAGSATSDSIPAMLSNGEYVIKTRSVDRIGRDRLQHMNEYGEIPAFARGGTVGREVVVQGRSPNPVPDIAGAYASGTRVLTSGASAYAAALAKAVAKEFNAARAQSYSSSGAAGGFSAEQMRNAATIASVGSSMGRRAQIIGIATAIVESGLRNLSYGDRDSVGLFQQRAPWGSFAARTNPRTSAGMFFRGGRGGQPGLDDIRGWQSMPMGQAAQRVQVSAFPGRYAQELGRATNALGALSGGGGGGAPARGKGGRAWPTIGRITSTYRGHDGVDINRAGGDYGDPIYAYRSGVITHAGYGRGYGNAVFEQPDVGPSVVYGHASRVRVKRGQRVTVGQVIANIGSTGNSTGDHLHFGHPGGTYQQAVNLLAGLARGGVVGNPRLFDTGGFLPPGRTLVQNNTGRNELVLNPSQMKAFGFATGGVVGSSAKAAPASSFGSSTRYNVGTIVGLVRALQQPVTDLTIATSLYRKEQAKAQAAAGALRRPRAALSAADKVYDRAVARRQDLREEVAALKKKADATKGATAADRAYKKAQAELRDANSAVTRSSAAKQKAQEAYDRAAEKAKASSDVLREAQEQLAQQQKAVADTARSLSDTFRDAYSSKSTDASDWIALMKEGTADIGAFTTKIAQLRRAGLSETLVQQIIGMGAVAGTDIATQIAKGGKSMVDGLNKANQGIQDAADKLGYTGATGQGRYAGGGPVYGPGTGTSDSIRARLSNGEWVVPEKAASVPANRRVLEEMTYGRQRQVIERNYAQSYRYGGPVYAAAAAAPSNVDESISLTVMGDVRDPDRLLRRAQTLRSDKLARRGLRRPV